MIESLSTDSADPGEWDHGEMTRQSAAWSSAARGQWRRSAFVYYGGCCCCTSCTRGDDGHARVHSRSAIEKCKCNNVCLPHSPASLIGCSLRFLSPRVSTLCCLSRPFSLSLSLSLSLSFSLLLAVAVGVALLHLSR